MACVFCGLQKTQRGNFIFENDGFFSVYDIHPVQPGHALVIAKKHVESIFDVDPALGPLFFDALRKTQVEVNKKFGPAAYNLGVNDGNEAGRVIDHVHVHVIPRYAGQKGKGIEAALRG